MFDWNQNVSPTRNVEQTSSNMHATRSNIVDPTKCFITMFERLARAFMYQPEPHWLLKQRVFCSCGWYIWITKAMLICKQISSLYWKCIAQCAVSETLSAIHLMISEYWRFEKSKFYKKCMGSSQVPQAQCEHGRQKCKDLHGNPDKKLKKIIIWKKSQLKSLALLPLWVASFLCGYFPDPMQLEPLFNFWVINGYIEIPSPETKLSGATNLSQIFLDKMTVTIPHQNQLTKIELSFQPTINAIAVPWVPSGSNIATKQLSKESLYHQSGYSFNHW